MNTIAGCPEYQVKEKEAMVQNNLDASDLVEYIKSSVEVMMSLKVQGALSLENTGSMQQVGFIIGENEGLS